MTTIPELSHRMQVLLTQTANTLARSSGFIQRERKVTGAGFAQALVLGGMGQAGLTRKGLHRWAVEAGVEASVQALDQRFTAEAVTFMSQLLASGLTEMVASEQAGTVLSGFNGVYVTDCTQIKWGDMGIKVAVRWELQHGRLQACVSAPTCHDQNTEIIDQPMPPGGLHLADLGFFKLKRFQQWHEQGVYWLSRLKVGTRVSDASGQVLDLTTHLTGTEPLCLPVRLGTRDPVDAYLLAAPLSEKDLSQRQAHLRERSRRSQRPLSPRQLALSGWTIYVTNLPELSFPQAHLLARTRWQIELLFKLWKSHGHLLRSRSAHPYRQQVEGYAKLLGLLVAHWLLLVSGWHLGRAAPLDGLRLVQTYVPLLLRALAADLSFDLFFAWFQRAVALLPPLPKRRKIPLAFQLWQHFTYAFP